MGLRDKYTTTASPTTSAGPTASAPVETLTSVLNPPVPASVGLRDLSALRAKLAQSNGGVNPPEAKEALTEGLFVPTTRETADGGAEEIPAAAPTPSPSPSSQMAAPIATSAEPAKRKRRTKAEMEAERAQLSRRHPEMSPPREEPALGGTIEMRTELTSQQITELNRSQTVAEKLAKAENECLSDYSVEDLFRAILRRLG